MEEFRAIGGALSPMGALAFAITTGVALTTAFGFGLIPLGSIY